MVLIIGAMTPETPESNSFETFWNSPTGIRASADCLRELFK